MPASTSSDRYQPVLAAAIDAALEAGDLLRAEFHRPGGPRGHGGHAEVDERAEWLVRARILNAFPAKYVGEETGSALGGDGQHVWLVDPNDGTSAYLQGWRGSAVSIALLRQGVPVLGVVYAMGYPDDRGDLFTWAEGCGPVTRNGQPVAAGLARQTLAGGEDIPAIVFISQAADKNPAGNAACVAPARYIAMPSIAYRLALAAAGAGVAAVSLNGPGGWDYAGGHALLIGAGGVLIDGSGQPASYGLRGESFCERCFGGAPAAVEELRQRDWDQVYGSRSASAASYGLVQPVPGMAVADPDQLSRAQGCLLGQLAGDSLGGLVEFQSADQIAAEYPQRLRRLATGGCWGILPGQPTDDSELALMLARSIVQTRGYQPEAALDAYLHWYRSPPFDIGTTTRLALGGASRGATPEQRLALARREASHSSQSNGSLMRISPLAIRGAGDPLRAAEWARTDSDLTHPHPVCRHACAVFVAAVATAIASGGSADDCYQAAQDAARRLAVESTVESALAAAVDSPPDDYYHHQGWVLIALQNAFYQLLHAPTLEEGIVGTVMAGGDTDTNGAIAGALLGAVHGRQAIPTQWLDSILTCRPLPDSGTAHPRPIGFWPVDAPRLAERLLALGCK
ncbi:MAG: ADP-ribosylglycohydrolase family protein [Pirellulaceae bacterium]|nr:ADP-ribosylglycohydrolase family protein [Pirellulaceae bacterium]